MAQNIEFPSGTLLATLLPQLDAFQTNTISADEHCLTLSLLPSTPTAPCPLCMEPSRSVHSQYIRTLADLPLSGRRVVLHIQARRFFCRNAACVRRIFCERLTPLAGAYRRQTDRLYHALQQIGLALGGTPGARLATTLWMPTSWMTILRRIRTTMPDTSATPRVLGVDDWSWRKGRRYGTLLVDLEQQRPIDLLPDRTAASLAAWLKAHPGVEIISRDRGGVYADGARQGAPQALQVADRFHLVKNMGDCLERLLHRKHAELRQAAQAAAVASASATPDVTTLAAPTGVHGRQQAPPAIPTRRQQRYADIQQLHAQGMSIHAIARTLHLARNTVRTYLRAAVCLSAPTSRTSLLTPYEPYLWQRWQAGCHNATQLWHEIKQQGFKGGISIVRDWVSPWRTHCTPHRVHRFSPRHTMWLLRRPATELQPDETAYVTTLVTRCPDIALAQVLTREFITMIHERDVTALAGWLRRVHASTLREFKAFADGIRRDYAAVEAALSMRWNNGAVEGHINRLKLLKRQAYGRAGFDLLRQRVLHAP